MAQLVISDRDDVVVASFAESRILDEGVIRQIGEEFKNLTTEAAASRKLLLKFDRVTFMSSSMIGQILRLNKQCKADRVALKLCNISPSIMEVFTLTRLDKVLDIQKTEADALKVFGPPSKSWFNRG